MNEKEKQRDGIVGEKTEGEMGIKWEEKNVLALGK